jgi:hypothetical protein
VTTPPGDDEGARNQDDGRSAESGAELTPAGGNFSWRSETPDDDIDAAFAAIISGITTDASWTPLTEAGPAGDSGPQAGAKRHPSGGGAQGETGEERARRRELRRLERAEAQQAEIQAERDADEAHFEPPEPPPLPRPKGRTIGALLMLFGGIILLARPGLLAVGFDLTLVIAVVLILGGVTVLLNGIWRRRDRAEADGWDDGAEV